MSEQDPRRGADSADETRPQADAAPARPVVDVLGGFAVEGKIGEGGMGTVWRVRDAQLSRTVAAKVIRGAAEDEQLQKFVREAQLTGSLEHPNIVPVHAFGEADGVPFFTMKEIRGDELEAAIGAHHAQLPGALTRAQLIGVFLKACDAVSFAHSHEVIHRDLKPANIMVGQYGEVLVMDWGLAKRVGDPAGDSLAIDRSQQQGDALQTMDGTIVGTPAYMPPEQAAGRIRELDARADVYALGAILYHLLTGVMPYRGPNVWEVLDAVAGGRLTPPREHAPEIPWELEAVVLKAMAFHPADRYADVAALQTDVYAYLDGRRVGAARYSVLAALWTWARRNRAIVFGAAAVLITALGFVARNAMREQATRRARATAVALHWSKVRALEPQALLTRAAEATRDLAEDPTARPRPPAADVTRLAALSSELQKAARELGQLLRVDPDDARARALRRRVLLAMGRIAETAHEDALARLAYDEAARLADDATRILALARRAGGARARRLGQRAARVAERLEQAGAGELRAGEMTEAVIELAGYREQQTVALLLVPIRDATRRLGRAARTALVAVADPDERERARGALPLPGLERVVDAWISRGQPYDEAGPALTAAASTVLREAQRRFCERRARATGRSQLLLNVALALIQRDALQRDGIDRARQVHLACEVLGRIGDASAARALARLLCADYSETRSIAPGLALARLMPVEKRASRWLADLVGLGEGPVERRRFKGHGPFWTRVGRLVTTGPTADGDSSSRMLIARSAQLMSAGKIDEAAAVIDQGLQRHPRSAALWNQRGLLLARKLDRAGAITCYDRAIALSPTLSAPYVNKGSVQLAMGDIRGAITTLTRGHELARHEPATLMNRAQAYIRLGELDKAEADLKGAERLQQPDARTHNLWGNLYRRKGQPGNALAAFDRALDMDPALAVAHFNRATVLRQLGKPALALQSLDRAIESDPQMFSGYVNRALMRREMGDLSGALRDIDKALKIDPKQVPLRVLRGDMRVGLRDYKGAVADYTAALKHGVKNEANAHYGRGTAHAALGERTAAMADFERAIALDPRHFRALNERGGLRRHLKQDADAERDFRRSIEIEPTWWMSRANLGMLLVALGRTDEAKPALRKALELAPPRHRQEIERVLQRLK